MIFGSGARRPSNSAGVVRQYDERGTPYQWHLKHATACRAFVVLRVLRLMSSQVLERIAGPLTSVLATGIKRHRAALFLGESHSSEIWFARCYTSELDATRTLLVTSGVRLTGAHPWG
jgi:hypothetical protein